MTLEPRHKAEPAPPATKPGADSTRSERVAEATPRGPLNPAAITALQRSAGNRASGELIRRRSGSRCGKGGFAAVQRYQAGEPGHGGIEAEGLGAGGAGLGGTMTSGEVGAIYLGNWMRDFSQVGDPHDQTVLSLLNVLSMGEFNRPVTAEQVGGYLPSEHMDRPTGGGSAEDPTGGGAMTGLSAAQQQWVNLERNPDFQRQIADRVAATHLPAYIEVSKENARRQLSRAARAGRGNPDGSIAMGAGLHAIEDYFSHSNFVDACVYTLVRDHQLPPTSSIYTGIVARARTLGYDPSGGASGAARPNIYTGSYRSAGNKTVSLLEQVQSEIENGSLRRAAFRGAIRVGMINAGALGRQGGSTVGGTVVGGLAATGGAVVEGTAGLAHGAAEGWRRNSGWRAATGAIGGAISGGGHGVAEGAQEGWQSGSAAGREGGGAVGQVIGEGAGAALEAAAVGAVVALVSVLLAHARSLVQVGGEAVSEHYTNVASRADANAHDVLPNHSQLAKDATDHPLFRVSRHLAVVTDAAIGRAMIDAWAHPGDQAVLNGLLGLVDFYVSNPADNDWWRQPLLAAANSRR